MVGAGIAAVALDSSEATDSHSSYWKHSRQSSVHPKDELSVLMVSCKSVSSLGLTSQ